MSIVAIDVHPQRAFSEMCPDEVPVADALSIVPHLNRQASWADFRVLTKDAHVPDAGWIVPQQSDHLPLAQALGDQHQSVAFFGAGCPCALLGRMVILTRPLPAPPLSTWLVFML